MKHTLIVFALIALASICSATTKKAVYSEKNYSIEFTYNDVCQPGDALFLRMKFSGASGIKKAKLLAVAELLNKKQHIETTTFYPIKSSMNNIEMLAGIPVPVLTEPDDYIIQITYSISESAPQEFSVPLVIQQKDFQEQTITYETDDAIPQQTITLQKLEQDRKFNTVFETTTSSSIYSLASFISPVENATKESSFGKQILYKYPKGGIYREQDNCITYATKASDSVVACANGKIVFAEEMISSGNTIIIEHLPGLYSIYYHLQSITVKEGQTIKQKEKIGTTAESTDNAPLFQWEVRLNTLPVNPVSLMSNFTYE
ncbi:MAG: M23 family metallopeptidase [Treponema sp.]|nr:M23 family metallopeptidase [Treponema sp.]